MPKEVKLEVRFINMKKRFLAQIPRRFNYEKEEFIRALCWVYGDAVFGRQQERHLPIMMCTFIGPGDQPQYRWVRPHDSPFQHLHYDLDNDVWKDVWNDEIVPHAFVD